MNAILNIMHNEKVNKIGYDNNIMHNEKVNKTRYDNPGKPMKQTSFTV